MQIKVKIYYKKGMRPSGLSFFFEEQTEIEREGEEEEEGEGEEESQRKVWKSRFLYEKLWILVWNV